MPGYLFVRSIVTTDGRLRMLSTGWLDTSLAKRITDAEALAYIDRERVGLSVQRLPTGDDDERLDAGSGA